MREGDQRSVAASAVHPRPWRRRTANGVLTAAYVIYLLVAGMWLFSSPVRAAPWGWALAVAVLTVPGLVLVLTRPRTWRWRIVAGLLVLIVPGRCGVDLWATSPPSVSELRSLVVDAVPRDLVLDEDGGYGKWGDCFDTCTQWFGEFCAATGDPIDVREVVSALRSGGFVMRHDRGGWYGTARRPRADLTIDEGSELDGRNCFTISVDGSEQPSLPGPGFF